MEGGAAGFMVNKANFSKAELAASLSFNRALQSISKIGEFRGQISPETGLNASNYG